MKCQCCGIDNSFIAREEDKIVNYYDICPNCYWEQDPDLCAGGECDIDTQSESNHNTTLNVARQNYIRYGACDPCFSFLCETWREG